MGNPTDERQSARTTSLEISFCRQLLWKKSRVLFCQNKGFYSNKNSFIVFTPTFTLFQLLFFTNRFLSTSTWWLREHTGSVGFWNYSTSKGEVKCLSWIWCTWIRFFLISGHCSVFCFAHAKRGKKRGRTKRQLNPLSPWRQLTSFRLCRTCCALACVIYSVWIKPRVMAGEGPREHGLPVSPSTSSVSIGEINEQNKKQPRSQRWNSGSLTLTEFKKIINSIENSRICNWNRQEFTGVLKSSLVVNPCSSDADEKH